ncbi:hypothetical protein M885DRAFT_516280 [Pelagophyceae sp. CCMP2097]|nr:hypothetical protein M885DRAFT_516280 [Pelagophyceae sp. CCMP2097]|mmetsp:Transcript_23601/g.80612  ORF Transcript_23601/g.80612 Transcript_23601/m.80612 type:complete len:211 (-) Transcript_23601:131-763(-)
MPRTETPQDDAVCTWCQCAFGKGWPRSPCCGVAVCVACAKQMARTAKLFACPACHDVERFVAFSAEALGAVPALRDELLPAPVPTPATERLFWARCSHCEKWRSLALSELAASSHQSDMTKWYCGFRANTSCQQPADAFPGAPFGEYDAQPAWDAEQAALRGAENDTLRREISWLRARVDEITGASYAHHAPPDALFHSPGASKRPRLAV